MTALLLGLAAQVAGWMVTPELVTVGDTLWIARSIPAEPGVSVRVEPLEASDVLQPLTAPRWSYAEGTVQVTYEVALFRVGPQEVLLPGVDLVYPGGRMEMVPPGAVTIEVLSVLPDSGLPPAPKPSLGPVPQSRQRLLPAVALPLAAALLTTAAAVRRRRRRVRPAPPEVVAEVVHPPLESWIAAGESRAVATLVALQLRAAIAEAVPEAAEHLGAEERADAMLEQGGDPVAGGIVTVLRALERARFSPAAPADIHEVVDDAERAVRVLRASRAEPE
jgi:hypothetical protein